MRRNPQWMQPRGANRVGNPHTCLFLSGERTNECKLLWQHAGATDERQLIQVTGRQGPRPRYELQSCTGDSGVAMLSVAEHEQLNLVLGRVTELILDQQERGIAPVIVLWDTHGKHRSVALANLISVVLRVHGWTTWCEHHAVAYTSCDTCGCGKFARGGWCQEVLNRCREVERHGALWDPMETAKWFHLEQMDKRGRALDLVAAKLAAHFRAAGLMW